MVKQKSKGNIPHAECSAIAQYPFVIDLTTHLTTIYMLLDFNILQTFKCYRTDWWALQYIQFKRDIVTSVLIVRNISDCIIGHVYIAALSGPLSTSVNGNISLNIFQTVQWNSNTFATSPTFPRCSQTKSVQMSECLCSTCKPAYQLDGATVPVATHNRFLSLHRVLSRHDKRSSWLW